ncbi:scarecrow-like protein 14 [Sesamum indicum]|uniref:Scarecrow-like protein 14 n=1 Tax=Sesamum indicum TaxID=4182 RepID=A0A6I9TNU8_SESIN|nr:scarecrow-like protein 14 [Sesamum indicum]XP_011085021.1 scarecrow-like protein 14 [Sesamum indicum]XP_011085022.1 scarecrow-like protein 14 [Sesamum indicum]XP_011085023.1 scarecrow-like protein 14 [Sesamum indicum]XP_011085025.1 scarecrow-like protein 14 [Sesamum indicum]
MIMDQNYRDLCGPTSGIILNKQAIPLFPGPNLINNVRVSNKFLTGSHADVVPVSSHLNFDAQVQSAEGDAPEDLDFSDVVLKYINHILMEEDVEEKACMFQESAALQAAERSFYEVIGEKYPASADYQHVPKLDHSFENPDEKIFVVSNDCCGSGDMETLCPDWNSDHNWNRFYGHCDTVDVVSTSQSSYSSSSSSGTIKEGPIDSPVSTLRIPDIFTDGQSAIQFKKGVEEASKFLPNGSNLIVDLGYDELSVKEQKEGSASLIVKVEKKTANEEFVDGSRGKKNPYQESMSLHDERSNKQSAVYTESTVSPDMFDKVLLCSGGKNESDLRKALNEVTKSTPLNDQSKGSNGGKSGAKKKGGKRNVVDMRTLLTLCAQAVAADDRRTANEFLKQIRQHATPTGDGMQRLAHYFADGLEARMAGSGTQIYTSLINMPTSAADILKAYHIYLATCPFRKISNFFSNKTIMNVAEKVTKLHIIDFGILYGFQWPCFLQRLSSRPGGPPKLRVTGIDLPCPGFRPSERVEETGRRLASYAETFKVPFEFNAIAQKWETIKLEDLKIKEDELLVVNCLYRFRNLLDETVIVNSPRNIVLNLIRKMNPAVFVLGVVNGAYNAPFFITRFREALFHYSSFFDMLDANIPREIHERMLLEKTVFGREAMNVIACEAAERIERPETYKQWQVRNMRAGFEQLPLDKEIMRIARDRVKSYHKDFVIDEDGHWLLQGWKGRIVYALSSWTPVY